MAVHANSSGHLLSRDGRALMDAALGRRPADLVVVHADLFNVYTAETIPDACISVCGERIAHVGTGDDFVQGPQTKIVDATGRTVIPGLIDGHTHLASLAAPRSFVREILATGTTTIVTETMELYPVGGIEAVNDFLESLQDLPVKIWATAPAMASISPKSLGISQADLAELLSRDAVIGMGESYWQSVVQKPGIFLDAMATTLAAGKRLEGHTAGAKDRKLSAYTSLGVSSCHEPITEDQVLERLRHGIHVMIREGSIRSDLEAIAGISSKGVDLRYLCLVSDGVTPRGILTRGYMDVIVQKAIDAGFRPEDAVRMASLNVAEHFGLEGHIGGIAPGRFADMVLVPSLADIRPETVISSGRVIAGPGLEPPVVVDYPYAGKSRVSVQLPGRIEPQDFTIAAKEGVNACRVRVIDFITDLVTREREEERTPVDQELTADPDDDLIKISAMERNSPGNARFTGLLRGFGLRRGAVAVSCAWDTADILVAGAADADMALAVNRVADLGGGAVAVCDGAVQAEIPLPVYGLMTAEPLAVLADQLDAFKEALESLGCRLPDPLLTLSTLTTAAIPYLRICESGLVNLKDGKLLGLFY